MANLVGILSGTGTLSGKLTIPSSGGGGGNLQAKTGIVPSLSSQTIRPDSGYDGLSSVQINAMPSGTAGNPTASKGSVSNHAISVTPSVTNTTGYIEGGTKTGTAVTVSASELVSGSQNITSNNTYDVTNIASVVVNVPTGSTINNQDKSVAPTESAQSITYDSGYTGLGTVSVGAISSLYVGSEVARKTSSDLVDSNNTIVVPAGYYENAASKAVQSGTAGTPTATKGTVSNHHVTITPSVTNSAGWISSETKTGTGVTVTASELASGTATYTENDTYNVVGLETVTVNVQGGGSTWTVAEATHNTSYTGAVFNAPTGCTSMPGAYILYRKSGITSFNQYGTCVAIIHDASDDLIWVAKSTGVEKGEVSGVNDYYDNGKIVLDDDNTYGLAENGASYGLICIFGGTGSISFRRASATPSSDSTTISFTTNEEPAVYFAGMNGTGSFGSTHYAYTVAANDNSINATNFYTGNIGYYNNFTDAFSSSAMTITSPGSSTGGYFKSGATYNAYYLTTSDLGGSAYLGTKTITSNGTYDASTDGFDGYSSVTVNVSGVSLIDVIKRTAPSGNVTVDDTTSFNIRPYFFMGYTGMTSLSSNKASKLESYAFQNCTGLTAINCPGTTRLEASCFEGCSNLSSIILSNNYDLSGGNQFRQCSSLQDFVFWGNGTGKNMCYGCTSLRVIDIAHANVYNIGEGCFYNCSALKTIILRRTSGVILLANINAFSGTPFANGGTGGDIYIPKTLYDALGTGTNDYKAASNWSTIDGYGTITWHAIEGSYYETHYADGTLIPTT